MWRIVTRLPKLGSFPAFYYLCSQCHEIYLRASVMWRVFLILFCVPVSLLLGHLHPSCHNHFIQVNRVIFTKFFWLNIWIFSKSSGVKIPWLLISSITAFILDWNFAYNVTTLSLAALHFIVLFPHLIIHFCKTACGFISRRQGHNTATCLQVCEQSIRCTEPNNQRPRKEVTW